MDKRKALNTAKEYANAVRKELSPTDIILYGSYASGKAHKNSDIDIAVIFDEVPGNFLNAAAHLWMLAYKINNDIEPVLIDSTNDKSGFLNIIKTSGIYL